MTLQEIKARARLKVPSAPSTVINDTDLVSILNEGVVDIVKLTGCLVKSSTFDCTAEEQEYDISTEITDYLGMHQAGILWFDSVNSKWVKMDVATVEWLDNNKTDWRTATSSSPDYYWILGDKIGFYPTPDTTYSDGFKVYHVYKPVAMSADGSYPFGGSAELPWLVPYQKIILDYYEWLAYEILDKIRGEEGGQAGKAMTKYIARIGNMKDELRKVRPDLAEEAAKSGIKLKDRYTKF